MYIAKQTIKIIKMNKVVRIDKNNKLYIIEKDGMISTHGFEIVKKKGMALAKELRKEFQANVSGSMKVYDEYCRMLAIAHEKNFKTGWKSKTQLYAPFIGLEGKRVKVLYKDGSKESFIIGKSTGFVPCHIARKNVRSHGGEAICTSLIESFEVIS